MPLFASQGGGSETTSDQMLSRLSSGTGTAPSRVGGNSRGVTVPPHIQGASDFLEGLGYAATASLTSSLLRFGQQGPDSGIVYNGGDPWLRNEDNFKRNVPNTNRFSTVNEKIGEFGTMKLKNKQDLAVKLFLAGVLSDLEDANIIDVQDAYQDVLEFASQKFSAGQAVTVDEVINEMIRYRFPGARIKDLIDKVKGGGSDAIGEGEGGPLEEPPGPGEPGGPVAKTVERVTDLTDPGEARALLLTVLQEELGRDPTKAEYEDFVSTLHTAERENPLTRTTKTKSWKKGKLSDFDDAPEGWDIQLQRNPDGSITRTMSRESGFEAAAHAEDWAREMAESDPNYAEWQAVGTYLPATEEALGALPGSTG